MSEMYNAKKLYFESGCALAFKYYELADMSVIILRIFQLNKVDSMTVFWNSDFYRSIFLIFTDNFPQNLVEISRFQWKLFFFFFRGTKFFDFSTACRLADYLINNRFQDFAEISKSQSKFSDFSRISRWLVSMHLMHKTV